MRTLALLALVWAVAPSGVLGSTSLVELLSASPDHSLLLRAFQRARLVPDLNRLNGSTLFAPTNDAIRRATAEPLSVWSSLDAPDLDSHDNLQWQLRETLLYHCLNYNLFPDPNPAPTPPPNSSLSLSLSSSRYPSLPLDVVTLQESLYYPSLSPYNDSFPHPPTLPGSPPDDHGKPRRPPTELLDGEGQKVRVVARGDPKQVWIGVDAEGEGGIQVDRRRIEWAKNGVFVPVDGVLERPKDLASIIRSTPSLSTFASLLPESLLEYLAETSHVTLFAPTNAAWDTLSELEMRYLRSEFAELDMREILQDSASRDAVARPATDGTLESRHGRPGRVGYLERLTRQNDGPGTGGDIETLRNGTLHLELEGDSAVTVNGTAIESRDILAANGVLHTVPALLLPSGGDSLALTAEKYLLALECTRFVELLHSVNLSHYVEIPSKGQDSNKVPLPDPLPHYTSDGPQTQRVLEADESDEEEKGYTILALKDSLLSPSSPTGPVRLLTLPSFPAPGSPELAQLLSYHILPSKLTPNKLDDGMLVGTELRPASLDHARQKIAVSVQSEEGGEGEGWEKRTTTRGDKRRRRGRQGEVVIGFGNANAIAEPVEVGKSIIYLISTILEPPTSVISTAVSDLRLSTFVASVYSSHLDKEFVSHPAVTYLVPTNRAFEQLGLVMSYLLLPFARSELESVIKYHAIDGLVYLGAAEDDDDDSPQEGQGPKRYSTLEPGAEIYLERHAAVPPGGGPGEGDKNNNSSRSIVTVHGPTLAARPGRGRPATPANGELRPGRVVEFDELTETGLYHVVDQVELPPTVDVTVDKLLKGAKSTTMVELIRHANLSCILEGKQGPPDDDNDGGDQDDARVERKKAKAKAATAYTILCPSDKALSRLNLTYYLTHPDQLAALVKLHVIPTSSSEPPLSSSSSNDNDGGGDSTRDDKEDGTPLLLSDSITYPTLHSIERGGLSKYGRVAFKRWGTERGSWMVGIEGARGTQGESDSARVVNWGRATPWIVDGGTVAQGGGVILIDSVLLPWEPGWFRRWGWIALVVAAGVIALALFGVWAVRKWRRRLRKNGEGYERVEGEED